MSPRVPSFVPCALVLAALLPAAPARAAAPDPASSPLVRALLARTPAAAPATPAAPPSAGADFFHAPPTALGQMRTTGARPPIPALAPVRSASPYAPAPAGKLPAGEGVAGDLFGQSFSPLGDMFGDGVNDYVVGAPGGTGPGGLVGFVEIFYISPGGVAPPAFLYGDELYSYYGYSVAGVGDVNGDGYPDLLVGAPFYKIGLNSNAGRAYLYLGSAFGIQPIPVWTFTTGNAGDEVGYSVAWAGDVNNDGYDDWLVGAPGASTAYLFKGGPGALSTTPAWTDVGPPASQTGASVATAGDVNGDGFPDILVGAPGYTGAFASEGKVSLFFGHAIRPSVAADDSLTGGQPSAFLGQSVAGAGDIDGNGYADYLAGGPGYDDTKTNQGEVLIRYGGPLPALYAPPERLEGGVAGASFGQAVGTAGDVNGDGYADIVVGATGIVNSTNQGQAFVFVGSQLGTITAVYDVLLSGTAGQIFGVAVGTIGDVNGDGCTEPSAGSIGSPYGELWSHAGQPYFPGNTEIVAAQGYDASAGFGTSVAAADVNGDGYDDLIVGSNQHGTTDPTDGEATIYFGGPQPFPSLGSFPFLGAPADWTFEGEIGDNLGWSVANAGDVNGDGYQDFVVGVPTHTDPDSWEGAAELFYGSPGGPVGGAPWIMEGNQPVALAGYSVSGDGDLNGDGYDDVIVGIPQGDVGTPAQGLVKVYDGSKFGLAHTPAATLQGARPNALFGVSAAIVGDINGDGFDDVVAGASGDSAAFQNEGIAYVYYGSATGVHATPDDSIAGGVAGGGFGWGVFRIGDVNGDGYADVAIGSAFLTDSYPNEGRLTVFLGSAGGLQKPASWSIEGGAPNVSLGQFGVSGTDMNGDGYADLVLGIPNSSLGAPGGGAVVVFAGGPSGISGSILFSEYGNTANWGFGRATLGHADFDGDGFPDLVYTGPGTTLASSGEGIALLRFGNCIWFEQRNPDRPLAAWRADDSAPISPGLRSDATNAIRLHGRARSAAGRVRMRQEAEIKPVGTPFNAAGHAFSGWQATGPIVAGAGTSTAFDQSLTGLAPGTRYHWRARWLSRNLFFPDTPWFGTEQRDPQDRHFTTAGGPGPVAVDPLPLGAVALAPAAPNPSLAAATLSFSLPRAGAARLALYDLRGALVRTLFDGPGRAGVTRVQWDGRDATGRIAPAGAYFVRLVALGEEKTQKIVHVH